MGDSLAAHSGRLSAVAVPLVLALVFGVGLATRERDEVYPFAQWAMFSRVPASLDLWTLRIHAVDGQDLAEPPLVREVPAFANAFASGTAYRQIDSYGRALLAVQNGHDRRDEVERFRRLVERRFGSREVTYEVVNVRGNPLGLLDGETPQREVTVGTFTVP